MDTTPLVATGLNEHQAKAYLLLLEQGSATPPTAAKKLNITRSNAYKLFDRLVEMGLAQRKEVAKKFVYEPANPLALSNIVAEQRNLATAREEAVKNIMGDLLTKYHEHAEQPAIEVVTGKDAVVQAYRRQIQLQAPVYFIRSRADIPMMGFDTMHELRVMPARHGVKRYGITPDVAKGPINPAGDKRSNLERTWVKQEDYSAPVEWSVSGSQLLIVLFGSEPHAITIDNPLIADAFRQLWQLLDTCLRAMPYYADLPRAMSTRN